MTTFEEIRNPYFEAMSINLYSHLDLENLFKFLQLDSIQVHNEVMYELKRREEQWKTRLVRSLPIR